MFQICKTTSVVYFASGATLKQLASVSVGPTHNVHKIVRHHSFLSSLTRFSLLFSLFRSLSPASDVKLIMHVDNMAAVSFLNKGRANYVTLPIRCPLRTALNDAYTFRQHLLPLYKQYIRQLTLPTQSRANQLLIIPLHACDDAIVASSFSNLLSYYICVCSFLFSSSVRVRSFINKIGTRGA